VAPSAVRAMLISSFPKRSLDFALGQRRDELCPVVPRVRDRGGHRLAPGAVRVGSSRCASSPGSRMAGMRSWMGAIRSLGAVVMMGGGSAIKPFCPDVRFVALVTGPFDVVAEMVAPSRHDSCSCQSGLGLVGFPYVMPPVLSRPCHRQFLDGIGNRAQHASAREETDITKLARPAGRFRLAWCR
jgi:hypothetical protein